MSHLAVVVLAEVHPVLEQGQQGEVVLQGLGEGHGHPGLAAVAVDPAEVEAVPQALDEVVFGQPDPLVRSHAVVAEVLLAVEAVGGGGVLLVAGAALRLSQVLRVQKATVSGEEAGGASNQAPAAVVAVLVLDLVLRAHHHVQQVAEEEVGGRQGVHPGLGDGHLLVAGGAPQLQGLVGAALALQALPAEGVQAGQDVEALGGVVVGGGGGVRGAGGGGGAGGDGGRGSAQLLAERTRLQVRVWE